jgi:hypothetical protein
MSLVIAVIYNQFKGFFQVSFYLEKVFLQNLSLSIFIFNHILQDSMLSSAFRQSLGIRAAFWVLYKEFSDKE